jgi:hypothetical protein
VVGFEPILPCVLASTLSPAMMADILYMKLSGPLLKLHFVRNVFITIKMLK